MERAAYPVKWAREWLSEWYGSWAYRMPERFVRNAVARVGYDGGWDALEETARADYAAGCRV